MQCIDVVVAPLLFSTLIHLRQSAQLTIWLDDFQGTKNKSSGAHVKVSIQVYRANAPLTRNFLKCTNKREGGGSQIWDCPFISYLTLYSSYCYSPTGPDWIRPGMVTWRTLSSRNGFCCKNFLFPITLLLTPAIFWTDDVRKYFHAEISTAKRKSSLNQVTLYCIYP